LSSPPVPGDDAMPPPPLPPMSMETGH
jgi:hypothetical protein